MQHRLASIRFEEYDFIIFRLNSGNFGIFHFTEPISNLDSSVCKSWKIASIDTKISMIPWETDTEKSFWNFCVGVWVGGQPRANFLHISKDAKLNSASFNTSIVTGRRWEQIVLCKKLLEKWILSGLKLRRFDQNQLSDSN